MSADLAAALLRRVRQDGPAAGIRLGRVTAIDTTAAALTVDLSGALVSSVRWVATYSPAVGDFVVVVYADGAWVVLGKLSKDLSASPPPVPVTEVLVPSSVHMGSRDMLAGPTWSWDHRPTNEIWPISQGRWDQRNASGSIVVASYIEAGIVRYPASSLAALLPPGAVIQTAKVKIRRRHSRAGAADGTNGSPVIYGHAYTSNPSGAPSFVSGFGPWRPGTLDVGQTAQWNLPSAWVTAWLAGTIRGFGIYSTAYSDYLTLETPTSFQVAVTYTVP